MVVSTVKPEQLMKSLGKEKVVLIPLSEYQALLDRLKELESSETLLRAEVERQAKHKHSFSAITDSQAALDPISLKGVWGPVVVDEDDFAAARRSLFKPIHESL